MQKRRWIIVAILFAVALTSRLCVSTLLASDEPGDSRVYSQLARNMLEGHGYSAEDAPPYDPTLIRVPGYPLFLAGVYAAFGHTNDSAVRVAQALLDTHIEDDARELDTLRPKGIWLGAEALR